MVVTCSKDFAVDMTSALTLSQLVFVPLKATFGGSVSKVDKSSDTLGRCEAWTP